MIIIDKGGNVYVVNEADKPRVVVGGDADLMACAKQLKAHCAERTGGCDNCEFNPADDVRPCRLYGIPDDWEV